MRQVDYPEYALEATVKALLDANITYDEIEEVACGACFSASFLFTEKSSNEISGDTCVGQRSLYALGMTSIPIHNVSSACSTGSSALFLARRLVELGGAECTLALGFEVMAPGIIVSPFKDSTSPLDKVFKITKEDHPEARGPPNSILFGNAGQEYIEKYGATWEHVAASA